MSELQFTLRVHHNEYLPEAGRLVDAAISLSAAGAGLVRGPMPSTAQVILVDCSSSMSGAKITEAKRATAAAIDAVRDGTAFAVVAGTTAAQMVFPTAAQMVRATAATRAEAREAVRRRMHADGGTAISTWLEQARRLLSEAKADIRHAILLTDGQNMEPQADLERVLARCRGGFVCDSRGVGAGWSAATLLAIADALLGSADGLRSAGELAADFLAVTEAVMGKAAADVALRLWLPAGAQLRFLKQMHPRIIDLTDRGVPVDTRSLDFPTASWGAEARDYHLAVTVPAGKVGETMRAARVSVVVGGEPAGTEPVTVEWTDDRELSTRVNPEVAHYTGQAELTEAIQQGLAARKAGDLDLATARLGRAVALATKSGHQDTLKVLAGVVDVLDAAAGTVRLRADAADFDAEMAEVRSTTTVLSSSGAVDALDTTAGTVRLRPDPADFDAEMAGVRSTTTVRLGRG